jgi:hypothetical protein
MLGLLLNVVVHSADVQDRDGAPLVLDRRTRRLFPFIERIFADAGYQGAKTAAAIARPAPGRWRSSSAVSCVVSSSCPSDGLLSEPSPGSAANRRLSRDFERCAAARPRPQAPCGPNQVWSYDFVFDRCANGQQLKCPSVTDEFTKEGLAITWMAAFVGLA